MEENHLIRDGFQPGMNMEVLSDEGKIIFVGRIKAIDENSVTLVSADGTALPASPGNKPVRLSGKTSSSRTAVYDATLRLGSRIFWKIGQPHGGPIQNKREFYRQPVSVEAYVILMRKKGETRDKPGLPSECVIQDVSGGGIRIGCGELFEEGDHLLVMDATLVEGQDPFDFSCEIRRAETDGEEKHYGCQFEALNEQEQARLISALFLLQKKDRNRQKQQ